MHAIPLIFKTSGNVCRSYVEISRFVRSSNGTGGRLRPNCTILNTPYSLCQRIRTLHQTFVQDRPADKNQNYSFLDDYKESLRFPPATHELSDLAKPPPLEREEVVLHGYLGKRTDLSKNFYFVPLLSKDLNHSIQIVSSAKSLAGRTHPAHERLKSFAPNTPVIIKGLVKVRVPSAGKDLGDIQKVKDAEIELWDVQSLNEFPKDIITTPETSFPPESRHLQIRSEKGLRDALAFRGRAAEICRDELSNKYGFIDVETPLLFKSTPEGAREFIVPTRRRGLAYALPQSPQQFKQIVMASGIPRYYQLARCFRDEGLRADRQPEFTQLDLEMAFATGEEVMRCMESVIHRLWNDLLKFQLPFPIPRMTYRQAMSKFGSDKPDLRPGMSIFRIDHLLPPDLISMITSLLKPIIEVMILQLSGTDEPHPNKTRDFITEFMESPEALRFHENPEGGPGIFIYDTRKPLQGLQPFGFEAAEEIERLLEPKEGDLIILQARKNAPFSGGSTALGDLRLALHKAAVKQGYLRASEGFEPVWITDFPLFSPSDETEPGQGGTAGLASTHHPFTSPKSAKDVDLLMIDPLKVIGEHYDLVMNGVELGGGSRRIHNARMQRFVMKDILKMTPERIAEFSHLLEALRAGCPPHAGIALGFDRLIAVMLGKESVRDVMAFPKSGKGEDLLVKSPSVMSESVLKTYHLQLRGEN